jgi:hypothetical protein
LHQEREKQTWGDQSLQTWRRVKEWKQRDWSKIKRASQESYHRDPW